jgi:hypothetical protein
MEKELLFKGKENTTSVNIKEFSPKGAVLDITLSGKIGGKVEGFILSTHSILMKPDRTSEVAIRAIISSKGEAIFAWGKDTGKVVDPMPIGKIFKKRK